MEIPMRLPPLICGLVMTVVCRAVTALALPSFEPIACFESGPYEPERCRLFYHTDHQLYGVSRSGGANGAGAIYRIGPSGALTTLAHLPSTGGLHKGSLTSDGRGFLWGTSFSGGAQGRGRIYKYELATAILSTVIDFPTDNEPVRGRYPFAGLVLDERGVLWGTTNQGGVANVGTVFSVDSRIHEFRTYAEFTGAEGAVPGAYPRGNMIADGAGYVWGTTTQGGANFNGTIFKVNTATGALTTVAIFDGTNGSGPEGELALDGSGYLWGTTHYGAGDAGVVFKVQMATGVLTKVVGFTGSAGAFVGSEPVSGLVLDDAGYFWGTTAAGGNANAGTVFKVHAQTGTFISILQCPDTYPAAIGNTPDATLTKDAEGRLWGTTRFGGGPSDGGTVFKILPASDQVATARQFTGAPDGEGPAGAAAGVSEDSIGNLWGTTYRGGFLGYGAIYKINPATGVMSTVCSFGGASGPFRGAYPECTLRSDGAGSFWGTTNGGGAGGYGTIFKVNMQTGAFTSVAEFAGPAAPLGAANGSYPRCELTSDGFGFFWGTTQSGGDAGKGTIFKVNAQTGNLVTVFSFTGQSGSILGAQPTAGLYADGAGYLWGTTLFGGSSDDTGGGTVFKVHIGTGAFTNVANFVGPPGSPIGRAPVAGLVPDGAGFLWGTTSGGGPNYEGTVFKVNIATGSLTTVLSFTYPIGAAPGSEPYAGLVSDGAGSFWGTTVNGGPVSCGTIFKISTSGAFTNAFAFTRSGGPVPGCYPVPGYLLRHSDGNLYGVTGSGGIKPDGSAAGGGQIFRIRLTGALPPIQGWKLAELGHPFASDDADPERDGLTNLGEYGLLRLPTLPDVGGTPAATLHPYADGRRLHLFIQRDPARSDITLRVEAADDPAGPWQAIATSNLGVPFSGPGYVGGDSATLGVKTVEVRDVMSVSGAARRFLRTRVSR